MLKAMPDMECFGAWIEFSRLEPYGSREDDLRAGVTSATVAEIFRDKKSKSDPFVPGDFIVRAKAEKIEQVEAGAERPSVIENPGKTMRAIELLMYRMGGKDNRTQRPRYEGDGPVVKRG